MGRRNDKAREQSKAGERTGRATAVDGTRSEVMAGVGKGGTGFKGNAGGGWHSIRRGGTLKVRHLCNQCLDNNCGGHYERGRPEGGVNLLGEVRGQSQSQRKSGVGHSQRQGSQ